MTCLKNGQKIEAKSGQHKAENRGTGSEDAKLIKGLIPTELARVIHTKAMITVKMD
jgi:hypothetical protein